MKPLYLTQPVREGLGACLRPGGENLTRRALELLQPTLGSVVVDAGCGPGGGLEVLREYGLHPIGLDLEYGLLREAKKTGMPVMQSDVAHLPLATKSVGIIFCECAWNLTEKKQVLSEFYRALVPGGTLVLSDIYFRSGMDLQRDSGWPIQSCFSYATDLTTVQKMVVESGFEVTVVEDHIHLFKQTAAEFVFAHGSLKEFWRAVLGDTSMAKLTCSAATKTRPSLFLLIAKRSEE